MKKWGVFAGVLLVACIVIIYFISPYFAADEFKKAALAADAERLDLSVDFPVVRENLKSQFSAAMMSKMQTDPNMKNNPFASLGMVIGPAIIDKAVDAYVTPDGISMLVSGQKSQDSATQNLNPDIEASYEWLGLDRFRVNLKNSKTGSQGPSLVFERRGMFSWKLIKVQLPAIFFEQKNNFSNSKLSQSNMSSTSLNDSADQVNPDGGNQSNLTSYDEADQSLTEAYRSLRDALTPKGQLALRDDERGWIKSRNNACGFETRNECSTSWVKQRVNFLRSQMINIMTNPERVRIGDCFVTKIDSISSRLEGVGDSGSTINYADGHHMVDYQISRNVLGWRQGDPVRLCVVELPRDCPPGDLRGIRYRATDLRTQTSWDAADAEHMCDGA